MAGHPYRDHIISFLDGKEIEYRTLIQQPNLWHRVTCLSTFDSPGLEFRMAEKFRYGRRFIVDGMAGEYMLSQVGESMACLVGLRTGNRLDDPINVDNYNITAAVIDKLACGRRWERVA